MQLKTIYDEYNAKGLEIYAVPCNQFGKQEPGTPEEIKEFVSKYDVKFPFLEKTIVQQPGCHPAYKFMRENSSLVGGDINWNFAKFLVDGKGKVVKYYMPDEDPNSILPDIKKLLN